MEKTTVEPWDAVMREVMSELGRKGGKARMAQLSDEEKKALSRKGVNARKKKARQLKRRTK